MKVKEPTTIYSDDEVELDTDSETEILNSHEIARVKRKQIHFEFDDGENISDLYHRNNIPSNLYDDNDVLDNEAAEDIDYVRDMPHTNERVQRAINKLSKSTQQVDGIPREMDENTEREFFETVVNPIAGNDDSITMFSQLNLSRPLLRAVEASGYVSPTPIQAQVIPYALSGCDICASAVTGSGKTAAFLLPVLERLIFRPRNTSTIRILIVTPTRELATQIFEVLQQLAQFTDTTSTLICGGKKDIKSQEAILRQGPDIVICTPGRILDHFRNSHGISADDIDVLILDEADRLLELGFEEEVVELLKYCPANRQTLMFSATMTPGVEDLVKLSLRKPIRIKAASSATTIAPRLTQEFIKVRQDNDREATMMALINRSFNKRVICFFETKKETHRFYLLLKIFGKNAVELHGDMTQTNRYLALESFRREQADILCCTDVAARGLDIKGIRTVINAEMPRNVSTYVHRVGRTARAGQSGRAITLVSDSRRKIMKEVLKSHEIVVDKDKPAILSRTIATAILDKFAKDIIDAELDLIQLMEEEAMSRRLESAEEQAQRASNMLIHEDEIKSRPVRTWHQSEGMKQKIADSARLKVDEEKQIARVGKDEFLKSASKRAQLLALKDDYRMDRDENANKSHRLSRKKRRRLEAMKELDNQNDVGTNEHEDDEIDTKKKSISVKQMAKRSKVSRRVNEVSLRDVAIGSKDLKKSTIVSEQGKKIIRQKFASGGLDRDLFDWEGTKSNSSGGKKDRIRKMLEVEEFRGFDPAKKLRKGGKVSSNSFKSKKRFKRR